MRIAGFWPLLPKRFNSWGPLLTSLTDSYTLRLLPLLVWTDPRSLRQAASRLLKLFGVCWPRWCCDVVVDMEEAVAAARARCVSLSGQMDLVAVSYAYCREAVLFAG